jgi:hypothetical protein
MKTIDKSTSEITDCEYNEHITLVLRSGNCEEVTVKGFTDDSIIVQSYKCPFYLRIEFERIKFYTRGR